MDYETVLEEQLEATELSELEDSLADAAQQSGVLEELSVEDLVHRLLNGQQILDSDQILENLKNLFLLEVRSSLMLGCSMHPDRYAHQFLGFFRQTDGIVPGNGDLQLCHNRPLYGKLLSEL